MRNVIPVNTGAVNSLNQNGVAFVFPPPPVVTAGWRALRHEDMIARDGVPVTLRTLETNNSYNCILSFKRLKVVTGATPARHRLRTGYVSPVALARQLFTGTIRAGDVISTQTSNWHIEEAHLQEVAGEAVRWVLELYESGRS